MKTMKMCILILVSIPAIAAVSSCSDSTKESNASPEDYESVSLDLHPIQTWKEQHVLAAASDIWLGPLKKSAAGDEYIGRGNVTIDSLFSKDLILSAGQENMTGGAIGSLVNDGWKRVANRLLLRMPKSWWKIIPVGGEDPQTALNQGKSTTSEDQLREREGFSFVAVPKTRSQELVKAIYIEILPLENDSKVSKVVLANYVSVSVVQSESDQRSNDDRARRIEAIENPEREKISNEIEDRMRNLVQDCFDNELGVIGKNAAIFDPAANRNQFEFNESDLWSDLKYAERRRLDMETNAKTLPACPKNPPIRVRMTNSLEEARERISMTHNLCLDRKTGEVIVRNGDVQGNRRAFYITQAAQVYFKECRPEDFALRKQKKYQFIQ